MKKELSHALANIRLLSPGKQVAAGQPTLWDTLGTQCQELWPQVRSGQTQAICIGFWSLHLFLHLFSFSPLFPVSRSCEFMSSGLSQSSCPSFLSSWDYRHVLRPSAFPLELFFLKTGFPIAKDNLKLTR